MKKRMPFFRTISDLNNGYVPTEETYLFLAGNDIYPYGTDLYNAYYNYYMNKWYRVTPWGKISLDNDDDDYYDDENDGDDDEDDTPSDKGNGSNSSSATGDVYEAIDLINAERKKAGLAALEVNSDLMEMAAVRASEQPAASGHTRLDGSDWKTIFDEFGVDLPNKRGENAASGFPSANGVVNAWMNSSGHKANILKDNVTKIGVGYDNSAYGSTLRGHWVMIVTN